MSPRSGFRSPWLASLIAGLIFLNPAKPRLQTTGCDGCDRHGQVGEVRSPEWTPTDKDIEEIKSILLPGPVPRPGAKVPYLMRESVWYRLAEDLTSDCFHLRHYNDAAPAEYVFSADLSRTGPGDGDWKLVLDLYYDGVPREKVGTWVTTGTPEGCLRAMFKNDDAPVRKLMPIETNLFADFEKRPHDADVRLGRDDIMPGDFVDIFIENIRNYQGRPSREFNRIVVQAKDGEILGGVALESDPSLKAFKAEPGRVAFVYKAPKDCASTTDTITVFNSCDILSEGVLPLSKTRPKDKIAEKNILVTCADLTFRATATAKWEHDSARERSVTDAKAVIEGTMTFRRRASVSQTETFQTDRMTCRYEFLHQSFEKTPRPGCPALAREIRGSGQVQARPTTSSNYLRITPGKKAGDPASVEFHLSFETFHGRGKDRKGPTAPSCLDYREFDFPLTPEFAGVGEADFEKNETIVGRVSQGIPPGGGMIVPVFNFVPLMKQMFPGQELNLEWRIIRKKR
jgi:hypothetical protein